MKNRYQVETVHLQDQNHIFQKGKNLKLSKGEARARARENLLDLVKLVNFDGRTVGEMMVSDPLTESRVETLVGSAFQQGEIEYLERKEVAIALAIKMSGLAEILVDAGGYMNENLAQSTFLMTRNATPKSERTSGIVIDARSIYHVPAMVPKIFNENDKLVYGPRHYTRSRSVNRGLILSIIRPDFKIPKVEIGYCKILGIIIETLSPFFRLNSFSKKEDRFSECDFNSLKLTPTPKLVNAG